MDFKSYIKSSALEVEDELSKILDSWKKEVSEISPKLTRFAELFIYASQGGKRLRGTLIKLGFEMAGGEGKGILKPAAAFEIFQTAILAHDDVIDLSPTRRGRPTIYQALGGEHYGKSQAIGLGDAGLFLATKLIADSEFDDKYKNKALSFFSQTLVDTALGEILDVELPHLGEADEKDIIKIFELKTAYYTIIGPLSLGAILAGAQKSLLDQIYDFGLNLGIAFQIQDDVLGVFGEEETIGKSVTSDIEEGKITLLLSYAKEHGNNKDINILNKLYGTGKININELEKIKEVFKTSGALEYAGQKALEYVDQAKKVIEVMEISDTHKKLLLEMADFLVKRDK